MFILGKNMTRNHLFALTFPALLTSFSILEVYAAPIKNTLQSNTPYLQKVQVRSNSNFSSGIYIHRPFEPLTENRLTSSKNTNQQPALKVHQGDSWLEFTIQKGDTLYSLVRRHGLNIKELHKIMHVGTETSGLKTLKPGQRLLIHASDQNILEIIHHQNQSRQLHIRKVNGNYSGITTVDHIERNVIEPLVSRTLLGHNDNGQYPQLRTHSDSQLQKNLERTIRQLGLMDEISKRKLAVALVDITNINDPKVALLNGDEMMYAASLPKIAILLGAFVEIEQGNMVLDRATRDSLTQMIRFSSNKNATKMLTQIGNHRLREILMSDRYKLYDPLHNGGLWVGKAYGKTAAFERDPLHNLSHGATVLQAARFYYMMESGQLVSSELTADMKEILSHPKINHKFVKGLASRPEATIYRKSGSWRQWHADSALIEANGYKYIAVALAEDPKGGQWLSKIIAPMHDLIVPPTYAEFVP